MALCVVACGGGEDDSADPADQMQMEPERFPALEEAEPLALSEVRVGVGVHHGAPLAFAVQGAEGFERARAIFANVMMHVRSHDEQAHQYGEYTAYRVPMNEVTDQRSAIAFIQTPAEGDFAPRVDDLDAELDRATGRANIEEFEGRSVVMDLWRTNGEWYVRWDGLLSDEANTMGIGPYGLGRQDMVEDLLNQIEQVAREHEPTYFIIGDDMERLWATDGGEGISSGEWSAFLAFYQRAAARIRDASPDTKIGAGIHWDRFVNQVVPVHARLWAEGDEELEEAVALDEEHLDRAFRDLLLPLVEWGDVLSLKSYVEGGDDPSWYYQYLRRLPELYMTDVPVVWYSIAAPITNGASAQAQRNYLEDFLSWNAGVNVEAIYWARLLNIDGANGANQQITGRCESVVEDESKQFLLPRSRCFDGAFDSIYQPKEVFIELESRLGQ